VVVSVSSSRWISSPTASAQRPRSSAQVFSPHRRDVRRRALLRESATLALGLLHLHAAARCCVSAFHSVPPNPSLISFPLSEARQHVTQQLLLPAMATPNA
jgi:hypothetical protein